MEWHSATYVGEIAPWCNSDLLAGTHNFLCRPSPLHIWAHRFTLYNIGNDMHMYSTGFLTPGRADREQGLGKLVVMFDQWRGLRRDAHRGSGHRSNWVVQGIFGGDKKQTWHRSEVVQACGHRDGDEINSHGPRHFVSSYVFLFLTTLLIERNAEGYLGETLFEISRIHN
jgi:hypothetical protein